MWYFILTLSIITVFADQYFHPDVSLKISIWPERRKASIAFEEWIDKFRDIKIYHNETVYRIKYDNFVSNLIFINRIHDNENSFDMYGLNQFADYTYEEFIDNHTCILDWIVAEDVSYYTVEYNEFMKSKIFIKAFHKSIDWRDNSGSFVSAVRNQTKSTCWAMAPIQMLEGMLYRRFSEKYDINEDLMMNCLNPHEPPTERLNIKQVTGGIVNENGSTIYLYKFSSHAEIIEYYRALPDLAFQFLAGKGRSNESDYDTGEMIKHEKCEPLYDLLEPLLRGYRVLVESEWQIMTLVSSIGPVVAGIYVSRSFQLFIGKGVYDPYYEECPKGKTINHAVLIVGYGKDPKSDKEYWIVKNSWGTMWGDEGYAKIVRNKNACSIASYIAIPELFCECPFDKYETVDVLNETHPFAWPLYKKCKSHIEGCYSASRRSGTYQQYIHNETIDVEATKVEGMYPDLEPAFDISTLETETCKNPTSNEDFYNPGHVDTIGDCIDPRLWHERGAMWFTRNTAAIYMNNETRDLSDIYRTTESYISSTTIGPEGWDLVKIMNGSLVRKNAYERDPNITLWPYNNITTLALIVPINASYISHVDKFETTTWEPYFITKAGEGEDEED